MKVIIDRFEGDYAIVEIEIGKTTTLPKVLVPNAKEGDVIKIEIEKKDTIKRQEMMQELVSKVFEEE